MDNSYMYNNKYKEQRNKTNNNNKTKVTRTHKYKTNKHIKHWKNKGTTITQTYMKK